MIITKLIKIANCDNVSYGFPVKEIDYRKINKEVIIMNSLNEQTAGQAEIPELRPEWHDYKKTQLNCYYFSVHVISN